MPGLKRKNETAASSTNSGDANTTAIDNGSQEKPAKRGCRQPTEPLHMVTRRSASIVASTQNSAASSAIQSEVEDNQSDAMRSGHATTDGKTKARKIKSSAPKSNQSRSRASSAQENRKAGPPKLKWFITKPPDSVELQKIKHTLRNRKGAVPPTTQLSTKYNKRELEAGREDDESPDVTDTINQGHNDTLLTATTHSPTKSTKRKRGAGHHDEGTTNGQDEGVSLEINTQLITKSNEITRNAGKVDEKTTEMVDMAGVTDGVSNDTYLDLNTETPLEGNKRKREGGHKDEDGIHLAKTTNGEHDAIASGVDTEEPPAKRRGRIPKLGKVQMITSVERTPALDASDGNPGIPVPAVKRPPGRPRKGRPPVSRQGSETPARRLPGRQRAPDANPEVEAIRIRMADLKRNYREVARIQEAALKDLADRSIDELREGPNAHEQNDQFRVVQAGLDGHYVDNVIKEEHNHQRMLEYEETKFKAEQEVLRRECNNRRQEIKEAYISRLKHEYMQCVRGEEAKGDGDVTDDERVNGETRSGRSKSPVYSSHSAQFYYETECSWRDWQRRLDLQGALRAVNPPDTSVLPSAFTATDEGRRQAAIAEANLNLLALASEAAEERAVVEDLPRVRSDGLRNAQEAMLQGLADLAEVHPEYWMSKQEMEKNKKQKRKRRGKKDEYEPSLEDHLQRAQRHGMEYLREKNEEAVQKPVRSRGSRPREIRPASERPPTVSPGVTLPLPPPPPPPQARFLPQSMPLLPYYWPPPPPPPPQQFVMPPPPFYGVQSLMGPPPLPQPPYFKRQW